jgi:type I restriction enzyme S subunit
MPEFQEAFLCEVCHLVTDGTHDTPKTLPSGIPFIKAKEIVGGSIDFQNCEHISYEDHLEVIARSKPEKGDILFAHIGASLGESAFIKTDTEFSIKNVALFKPNPAKIDNRYLYYYIISPRFQAEIKNRRTGSAQPFVSLEFLRNHRIKFHKEITVQQKIGAILSAYDDLVESNTRRIKILEEMAQSIYKEWFVDFRFPGHKNVKFVDSPLGKIPEGWEIVKVEDIVERVSSGKKYDNNTVFKTGAVPVLDQGKSGIIGYHNEEPGVLASEEAPIIVFANHTCYQRIILFPFSAIQNVLPFVPKQDMYRNIYWLHYATCGLITFNDYKGHWPEFMSKSLLLPVKNICESFGEIAKPIVRNIYKLERKNKNLRRTRDLLLPKLISGEIDISDMNIAVPEEAAS